MHFTGWRVSFEGGAVLILLELAFERGVLPITGMRLNPW
jgi:hypothetical protein